MAIPHMAVPNISHVNWRALKAAGFEGCVFDKDNTLTEPYAIAIAPVLVASLKNCIETFNGRVVMLSNSAGLEEFDPEGEEAAKLEKLLGIAVLRHKNKKPKGGAEELESYFACKAEKLVMVGDRYLTDVVYGNQNGMFTIRPAPLTLVGEPSVVRMARSIEDRFVGLRLAKGTRAPKHPLIPLADLIDTFVKDPEPIQL
jgi:phosphatidylglycerophosphatase GEP4